MIIINLGCGRKRNNEEIGVDIFPSDSVDVLADLNHFHLPFQDNSVDMIISSHCLEHLDNVVHIMEEIHRVLKPSGIAEITVPHVSNIGYFRDPTHKHSFTYETFDYFVEGLKPAIYTNVEFEYVDRYLSFGKGLRALIGKFLYKSSVRRYEKYYAWKYPCSELTVKMRPKK